MKNPFERWMQPRQLSPEQAEHLMEKVMSEKLEELGATYFGLHSAYRAAKELNAKQKLGLTRNYLLNILRKEAYTAIDPIEEELLHQELKVGIKTEDYIDGEIERIRKEEQDEPQQPL